MIIPTDIRKIAESKDFEDIEKIIKSRSNNKKISDYIFNYSIFELFTNKLLSKIIFENCVFNGTNFAFSRLNDTSFTNCEIKDGIFSKSKFKRVDFNDNIISNSNFKNLDAKYLIFNDTKIHNSNFDGSKFNNTEIVGSDLINCELTNCNISNIEIRVSNLSHSYFNKSIFYGYNIFDIVNLNSVNFSRSTGLLNPIDYLKDNFKFDKDGNLIVYKIFNWAYPKNPNWNIKENSIITEEVNYDRTLNCACGINVGTSDYIYDVTLQIKDDFNIWECIIKPEWFPGIVVPYFDLRKIRTSKLMLIKNVKREDLI